MDGDTLIVLAEAGFDVLLRIRVRIDKYYAPEKPEIGGDMLWRWQKHRFEHRYVSLKVRKKDCYGRYLAEVNPI